MLRLLCSRTHFVSRGVPRGRALGPGARWMSSRPPAPASSLPPLKRASLRLKATSNTTFTVKRTFYTSGITSLAKKKRASAPETPPAPPENPPDVTQLKLDIQAAIRDAQSGEYEFSRKALSDALARIAAFSEHFSDLHVAALHFHLGWIYLQIKDFDASIRHLMKSIELNEEDEQAYYTLGLAYEEKGDSEAAISAYKKCISVDKGVVEAQLNLANLYAEQERHKEAEKHFLNAIDLHAPLDDMTLMEEHKRVHRLAHIGLAELYMNSTNLKKSQQPKYTLYHLERANNQVLLEKDAKLSAQIAEMFELYSNDSDKALEHYKEALFLLLGNKSDMQNSESRDVIAQLSCKIGDLMMREMVENKSQTGDKTNEIIRHYERALAIAPERFVHLHNQVGELYNDVNQLPLAVIHWERALNVDSDPMRRYRSRLQLGSALLGSDPGKALRYLEEVCDQTVSDAELPQADAEQRGFVVLNSQSRSQLFEILGHAYALNQRREEAKKAVRIAMRISPSANHSAQLAVLLLEEMADVPTSYIMTNPMDFYVSRYKRSLNASSNASKIDEIRELVRQGLELDEAHPTTHFVAGKIALLRNEGLLEAIEHLEKACQVSHETAPATPSVGVSSDYTEPLLQSLDGEKQDEVAPEQAKKSQNKKKLKTPRKVKQKNAGMPKTAAKTDQVPPAAQPSEAEISKLEADASKADKHLHLAETLYLLGVAQKEFGELEKAHSAAQQGMIIAKDNRDLLELFGDIALAMNSFEDATITFRRMSALYPADPVVPYKLANLLTHTGKHDQALSYYEKSISLMPQFVQKLVRDELKEEDLGADLPLAERESLEEHDALMLAVKVLHNSAATYYRMNNEKSFKKRAETAQRIAEMYQPLLELSRGGELEPTGPLAMENGEIKENRVGSETLESKESDFDESEMEELSGDNESDGERENESITSSTNVSDPSEFEFMKVLEQSGVHPENPHDARSYDEMMRRFEVAFTKDMSAGRIKNLSKRQMQRQFENLTDEQLDMLRENFITLSSQAEKQKKEFERDEKARAEREKAEKERHEKRRQMKDF